jgi:pimeloyl-ACP methyl ester carboxylesterase
MKSISLKLSLTGAALLVGASFLLSGCSDGDAQTLSAPAPVAAAALAPNTTAVLVHGAWAEGSSWNTVIPLLQQAGLNVVAVELPRTSLADDAAAVTRTIDLQTGPVILVGHSYGGSVITQAGNDAKVSALVYVAAFAPDSGQSINDVTAPFPTPAWEKSLVVDEGGYLSVPTATILSVFAPDVPTAQAQLMAATQGPIFNHCLADKVTTAAWHTKPSWWVVSGQDQVIPAALQQATAQQIGATVSISPESSHFVMVSHPNDVAAAIIAAANKTAAAK